MDDKGRQDLLEAMRLMKETADVLAKLQEAENASGTSVAPATGPNIAPDQSIDYKGLAFDVATGDYPRSASELDRVKELHVSELFDGDIPKATSYVIGATTEGGGLAFAAEGNLLDAQRSYAHLGASLIETVADNCGVPLDDVRQLFIDSVDFVLGERGHD